MESIQQRVIQDLDLGLQLNSIDSAAVGSITVASYLRNSNWSGNQFVNWMIHRPDAVNAADVYRYAGVLTPTSGLLAHTGANYISTTITNETLNILKPGIRPDQDIIYAINRALEYVFFQNVIPLTWVTDGDMQAANTTSWTATGGPPTLTKDTGAANVFTGIRALKVVNGLANDSADSVAIPVVQSEVVYVAAICLNSAGTSQLVLYDNTNGVEFGTPPATSEGKHTFLWRREAVPATCKSLKVRLKNTSATGVSYWGPVWMYSIRDARIRMQSSMDERFKVQSLSYANFRTAITGGGVFQAFSIDPQEIPFSDFDFQFSQPEANPTAVQFHSLFYTNYPIMIQGRRPYSDLGTLANPTDSTTCPMHLIAPATEWKLLEANKQAQAYAPHPFDYYKKQFDDAVAVRGWEGPARRKPEWYQARMRH